MTTKEKIKQYIEYKGISKNRFYTITGLSTSFLDSGNTIGVDKAKIIIEKFPDISMDWLILDQGPMIKESFPVAVAPQQPEGNISMLLEYLREKDKRIEALIAEATKYRTLYESCMGLEKARTMPDLGAHNAIISETAIYPPPLNSASPKPRKSRIKGQSEK